MTDGTRRRGRRPSFDRGTAVDRAMTLFWERGYEGTSYEALLAAMGISASSFQNAFGSKEKLFREAVAYYGTGPTAWYAGALAADTDTETAFRALIADSARAFTSDDSPRGCLVSLAGTQLPPTLSTVGRFATEMRQASEGALADRIRRGVEAGDVPAGTDAAELATFFGTVFRGMAIQARDGATREELEAVGRRAMACWPRRVTS